MEVGLKWVSLGQMVISGGLLVIKRVFKLPISLYYPPVHFWFRPKFWSKMAVPPGVSNPQGAGGPHFLGATLGIGLQGGVPGMHEPAGMYSLDPSSQKPEKKNQAISNRARLTGSVQPST